MKAALNFLEELADVPAADFMPPDIAVEHVIEQGIEPLCVECQRAVTVSCYLDGNRLYCDECIEKVVARLVAEARSFAKDNCRLTSDLPAYDESLEFRCSPEEYEIDRTSYSPNAFFALCRHKYTNYDELMSGFDRDTLAGQVFYDEIRAQILALITDEVRQVVSLEEGNQAQQ